MTKAIIALSSLGVILTVGYLATNKLRSVDAMYDPRDAVGSSHGGKDNIPRGKTSASANPPADKISESEVPRGQSRPVRSPGRCVEECADDSDCQRDMTCHATGCGHICF